MTIALPKNLPAVVTPNDFTTSYINTIVSAIAFLIDEVKGQFYTAPVGPAPANEVEARAEANYNDEDNDAAFGNDSFAATIEALTGFKIRDFEPGHLTWRVGMVVKPVKPLYRTRTDDGYELGVPHLVTNQTYGYARSAATAGIPGLKDSFNTMSTLNDEWELVTDLAVIAELVKTISDARGVAFVEDVLIDKGSGKSLQSIVEKYLS